MRIIGCLFLTLTFSGLLFAADKQPLGRAAAVPGAKSRSQLPVFDNILGVRLGDSVEEARKTFDRLKEKGPLGRDEMRGPKETRITWKLKRSDYSNVILLADAHEKITRLSATVRPGARMPFPHIADLRLAKTNNSESAAWEFRKNGNPFLLTVRGHNGIVETIYLSAVAARPRQ